MTKNTLNLCAVLAACAAFGYEGPTFDAAAWRGETVCVEVPEWASGEFGGVEAPEGFRVRYAGLDVVPYRAKPGDAQLAFRNDRMLVSPDPADFVRTGKLPNLARALVTVPVDAEAKVYELGPLKLRVVNRILPAPADWHYFLDLWQHPWAVSRYFGVKPFSKEHYAKMEPVWRTLAAAGQKALTVTLVDLPWNHQCFDAYRSMVGRTWHDDGTWSFDYAVFDEYVEFGRRCGIGPAIACYTMCPWEYVVRWKDDRGRTQRAVAKPGTTAFENFWGAFLVDFAAHLKEKGWFDDAYVAMDERTPDDMRMIADFVRTKAPGLRISLAGNRKPSDFKGIVIDNYSQILSDVTPEFLAELDGRREKGFKTTFYVCCWPPKPNTFMTSPDTEAFWLGAFPAMSGFDGFLRWAANSWPREPLVDAAFGNWAAGDTFLIYPDGSPSVRFEELRSGIVAAEKLRILKSHGLCAKEAAELAAKYDFKKAGAGECDFWKFRRELNDLVNR